MIYLENLSSKEKRIIEELHTRIINNLPKDMLPMLEDAALLYKFLKARDFDVDKAEKMLKRHISWRKHFQIETILRDFTPKQFFDKYTRLTHLGFDKKGNILTYFPMGNMQTRDIQKCVQINDYLKHWVWHFEGFDVLLRRVNRQNPSESVQITVILNMDKLTLANATCKPSIDQSIGIIRILLDNYPECLNAAYVINAPGYYVFIWSILKSMMSSALIKKIHLYGFSGWQEKLLDIIDEDVLPAFLGGNRTDPDGNPLCNSFVVHGGNIPEKYYLTEEERDFTNRSPVKRITIPSKQKKEISVHVAETGSRIYWEFLVKSIDIGFGMFYRDSELKLEEILPIEKYDTTEGVEKGSCKLQSSGNYIIVFDNSDSWIYSKEVDYYITVLKQSP